MTDIDLVLVAGAGASRDFGQEGRQLPLMNEWCDAIIKKLAAPGYLGVTGLSAGLDGPEFERTLGMFLRANVAFQVTRDLAIATSEFPNLPNGFFEETLKLWHDHSVSQLNQVLEKIHDSLYEQFGPAATNTYSAKFAYEALFSELGMTRGHSVLVATTNYDVIAESVLSDMGWLPDWGEPHGPTGSATGHLYIDGLTDGLPRFTPILHLHGRVGWFRDAQQPDRVTSAMTSRYQRELGVPVVALPDPDKAYDDPILAASWREFEIALKRARKVLVLGHSLHDEPLVAALRQVQPASRVAVAIYPGTETVGAFNKTTDLLAQKCNVDLPGAWTIPVRFGAEPEFHEDLVRWMNQGA